MTKQIYKTFRRSTKMDIDVATQLQYFLEKHPNYKVTKTDYVAENLSCYSEDNYEKENLFVEFAVEEKHQTVADEKTGKLIRDKIPDILKQKGIKFETEKCLPELYLPFLRKKLEEEYNEFKKARSFESIIEELADIIEVIYAIAREYDCSEDRLSDIRLRKKEERGGFEEFLILDSIETE